MSLFLDCTHHTQCLLDITFLYWHIPTSQIHLQFASTSTNRWGVQEASSSWRSTQWVAKDPRAGWRGAKCRWDFWQSTSIREWVHPRCPACSGKDGEFLEQIWVRDCSYFWWNRRGVGSNKKPAKERVFSGQNGWKVERSMAVVYDVAHLVGDIEMAMRWFSTKQIGPATSTYRSYWRVKKDNFEDLWDKSYLGTKVYTYYCQRNLHLHTQGTRIYTGLCRELYVALFEASTAHVPFNSSTKNRSFLGIIHLNLAVDPHYSDLCPPGNGHPKWSWTGRESPQRPLNSGYRNYSKFS